MLRFTIRELILLTLIVALGTGWAVDHFGQREKAGYLSDELALAKIRAWDLEKILDGAVPNWRATDHPMRPQP